MSFGDDDSSLTNNAAELQELADGYLRRMFGVEEEDEIPPVRLAFTA